MSLAILYNMVFVIGRAVFWELDKLTALWFVLDYLCDTIYLIDTVVHVHEGRYFLIALILLLILKYFFFLNLLCLIYVHVIHLFWDHQTTFLKHLSGAEMKQFQNIDKIKVPKIFPECFPQEVKKLMGAKWGNLSPFLGQAVIFWDVLRNIY